MWICSRCQQPRTVGLTVCDRCHKRVYDVVVYTRATPADLAEQARPSFADIEERARQAVETYRRTSPLSLALVLTLDECERLTAIIAAEFGGGAGQADS